MIPSVLYSRPAPVGAVIVIVPVGMLQVGCAVMLAVGAAGAFGTGFTFRFVAGEIHPVAVSFIVTG